MDLVLLNKAIIGVTIHYGVDSNHFHLSSLSINEIIRPFQISPSFWRTNYIPIVSDYYR